jgi:plasmid maintenance system antidote protein VapI
VSDPMLTTKRKPATVGEILVEEFMPIFDTAI